MRTDIEYLYEYYVLLLINIYSQTELVIAIYKSQQCSLFRKRLQNDGKLYKENTDCIIICFLVLYRLADTILINISLIVEMN